MPIFITQGRFTQAYLKGMMAKPEDRLEVVTQMAAKGGGKLLAFYMTFGEYDFMLIGEGTAESAAATVIAAAAGGGVTDLKTTLAMTSAEMKDAFAKAASIAPAYRAPG
jgi:uncharacterized protein with GYD domain